MKVTYEKLLDFQAYGQNRLNTEAANKKNTKLGECIKKMIGDAGMRIKGTLTDVGIDFAEKQEQIRRDHCSVDKDDNILRGDLTQTTKDGTTTISKTGPYLFTREKDAKCALALKNLTKETVTVEPVLCNELPKDLTEAEQHHLLGFVFTEETLNAWKLKMDSENNKKSDSEDHTSEAK